LITTAGPSPPLGAGGVSTGRTDSFDIFFSVCVCVCVEGKSGDGHV